MAKRKAKAETETPPAETEGAAGIVQAVEAVVDAAEAVIDQAGKDAISEARADLLDDAEDAQNAAEMAEMNKELDRLRGEVTALQKRLAVVTQADLLILEAQQRATDAKLRLLEVDAERKEAKKSYDSALINFLETVERRKTGQLPLPFEDEPAAAAAPAETKPAKEPKAKKEKKAGEPSGGTSFNPGEWEKEPAAPAEEKDELAAPAPIERASGWDPVRDASLGSVAVRAEDGGLESVSPGIVAILNDAGITSVGKAWDLLQAKELKIKGIGPTGQKKLEDILGRWIAAGGDQSVGAAPPAAPEKGEATGQWCSSCGELRALDAVGPCKCGEDEYIYKVGYYGEPACDEDGDFVVADSLKFTTKAIKGTSAGLLIGSGSGGYRPGFEVLDLESGEVLSSRYPNIKDAPVERAAALRIGFRMLYEAIAPGLKEKDRKEFLDAGRLRFGVDPEPATGAAEEPTAEPTA